MQTLILPATATTPCIDFNHELGNLKITGRAIPENAHDFWRPILKWVYAYASRPAIKTTVTIQLDYFNISSAKQLLFMLNELNHLHQHHFSVVVEWQYYEDDNDMREAGADFSTMVNFPFEIIALCPLYVHNVAV